jgi:hypothetical protein
VDIVGILVWFLIYREWFQFFSIKYNAPNSLSNIGKIDSTTLRYILMGISTKVKAEIDRSK